jgi:hypothetical protein
VTSLLTPAKLRDLSRLAAESSRATGVAAEVGVYRGGSAKVIAKALPSRALYLFDTYRGLPEPGPEDGDCLRAGQFAASLDEVQKELCHIHDQLLHFEVGLFPESAYGLEHIRFCFVHVDVDLFKAVHDCCAWFAPRMVSKGIMVFDDYSSWTTPGCPKAVDAFFKKGRIEVLPSGPAVVRF